MQNALRSALSSRLFSAILLGLLIGIAGLTVSPLRFVLNIEEDVGMGLLFKLRGARQPPTEAVIVSIDKESSENLNLPDNPDKWPRSLHARMVEALTRAGASVIAFDVHFIEPRSVGDDRLFAAAMKKSGNVVLCQALKLKEVPLSKKRVDEPESHNIVKVVQPLEQFVQSAVATAPFTLPRIPFKVSQYWTFETGAGDAPTMPAVAFQLHTLPFYSDFIRLLTKASPKRVEKLPRDGREALKKGVTERMSDIRSIFEAEPAVAERMIHEVENSDTLSLDKHKQRQLISLIKMYAGGNSWYLNYYGPPGTITTIPYFQALKLGERQNGEQQVDLKGKVVFVGLSEVLLAERKDSFYTVFSQANGTFIGGVEIMATAFSNIMADTPLKPAGTSSYFLVILFWGVLLGVLCRMATVGVAAGGTIILCTLYLLTVIYFFSAHDTWYPLVTPLLLQAPFAFVGAMVWNHRDATKELKNIKEAFGHYLPEDVVSRLSKDVAHLDMENRFVHGVCMFTDAQQFTTLSENMEPHELSGFMNRYYAALFKPVKLHKGCVSGVTGDSMLALWVSPRAENELKNNACYAALDIHQDLQTFRQKSSDTVRIKTRVGVHCGNIILGNVGALGHYEYTPMGDIVNTASRIEGLNKYLGTSVLVSADVVNQLDGFLSRDLGKFRLKGKSRPISAYELVSRIETSDSKQRAVCELFNKAMTAFLNRSWDDAQEEFQQANSVLGEDGPSLFYIKVCEKYKNCPPEESWDGIVNMDDK